MSDSIPDTNDTAVSIRTFFNKNIFYLLCPNFAYSFCSKLVTEACVLLTCFIFKFLSILALLDY